MRNKIRLRLLTLSALGVLVFASFFGVLDSSRNVEVVNTTTPTPTLVPTTEIYLPEMTWPLKWPLPMLTQQQLDETANCDLDKLASERYTYWLDEGPLPRDHALETPCDWAVLATAYTRQLPDSEAVNYVPVHTLYRAINGNLAFAYFQKFIEEYHYNNVDIVEIPSFAKTRIQKMTVRYRAQLANQAEHTYSYTITSSPFSTIMYARIDGYSTQGQILQTTIPTTVRDYVADYMNSSLRNLLTISAPAPVKNCYDLDGKLELQIRWDVDIVFSSNVAIHLYSNDSRYWYVRVNDQLYIQLYSLFYNIGWALRGIEEALYLPSDNHIYYNYNIVCPSLEDDALYRFFPYLKKP